MNEDLLHRTHPELATRLRRAEGHLRAIEKAIAEVKRTLIDDRGRGQPKH